MKTILVSRLKEIITMVLWLFCVMIIEAQSDTITALPQMGAKYEAHLLCGYQSLGTPIMETYVDAYRERRSGFVLYTGINRTFKLRNPLRSFGATLGLVYRRFGYHADNVHSTSEDIWSYTGNFIEGYGCLFVRAHRKNGKSSFTFGLMPMINLWGKYEEYVWHYTRFPVSPNYQNINSMAEKIINQEYFFDRMAFRVNFSYNKRINDHLSFQFAILPGVSSRIASFDFCCGVGWRR
ncbi:MAG: hypothetical protein K1X54_11695 [Flavobacteriales bacterium]|nr:hypothetical protein [Flavobacteriales bacterium]